MVLESNQVVYFRVKQINKYCSVQSFIDYKVEIGSHHNLGGNVYRLCIFGNYLQAQGTFPPSYRWERLRTLYFFLVPVSYGGNMQTSHLDRKGGRTP